MQALMPASPGKAYYKALSLPVKTAGRQYRKTPMPLFTIRAEEEAWSEPFIVLFEPFTAAKRRSVESVEKIDELCDENSTALRVVNSDGSQQIILQGNSCETTIRNEKIRFCGHFGVVALNREGEPEHLYLGEGRTLAYGSVSITAPNGKSSAELEIFDDKKFRVSSFQRVAIDLGEK